MYILEGNIGSGKSTFLRLVSEHMPHIKTHTEPVTNWQNSMYGQSILTNFYEDTPRWAYTFETLTMICRVQDHLKEQESMNELKLIERSIYSGYYCFAQNSHAQGFISDLEWKIYEQWFSMLIPHKCKVPRGFIYLQVHPDIAYERIKKRNRHAEKSMTLAYLKQIHQRHEEVFAQKNGILPSLKKVPVLILDCNEDFEANEGQMKDHLEKTADFFTRTAGFMPQNPSSNTLLSL
jgi:deoxyadenosine/deoxycytidine kinase